MSYLMVLGDSKLHVPNCEFPLTRPTLNQSSCLENVPLPHTTVQMIK